MSNLFDNWKRLSPEWRFALTAFLVARVALSLWSLVVYSVFPVSLQNYDFFGEPILTVFNLKTSERYVYSRQVDGKTLTFRMIDQDHVFDDQTGSIWSIDSGKALQGEHVGRFLKPSSQTSEDIFPYLGMPPERNVLLSLWQRFDANWYLKIAARGYEGSDGSTVYFPVYPILIGILSFVFPPMFAAMLISNLSLIGVLVLMYRLISGLADESTTRRALVYFLIFPTSFFLTAAYTESLFLLFALGSLYAASCRHWAWAVMWGTFAALTRLQGVLLVIPLAYMLWRESRGVPLKKMMMRALLLTCIPAGTLAFLAFANLSLINTYRETLHAKFVLPWDNIRAATSLLMRGGGGIVDALNLIVTLGLLAMTYFVWRKLPLEYALFSLLMLVAPMFRMTTTQPLVSMSRYALAVFPVFIVLGMWGGKRWVNRVVVYTSLLLQLYLSAQFILWGWVA
ncbi:MAG: hypothetical protein HXY35_06645 [Chloroflexi bacterium]|nr:hypothetical protein [Chloroflexota bacterium]